MNIDDLKDAWQNDEPQDSQLPVNSAISGKTASLVDRLRKNMRRELIALIICYLIMGWWLTIGTRSPLWFNISCILLLIMTMQNVFYYIKFYVFYKSISRYNASMFKSIRKIVYELDLNTEIYRAHSFTAIPLSMLAALAMVASVMKPGSLSQLSHNGFLSWQAIFLLVVTVVISFTLSYIFISVHIRNSYGRYLMELKGIMGDLGEEY